MDSVETLIVGAGITGLATAAELSDHDTLILEADAQIGGYCKTIQKAGFTWDYSGHFFHFKHPEIESWLRARMGDQKVRVVEKRSFISYAGALVDFPFQKNIHQLPKQELIDCLHDLYFARAPADLTGRPPPAAPGNFKEMLYARFGRSIAEKFLIPYNEKLYACDLGTLDEDAMGRFFPHADLTDVIANMKRPDNSSYNSTFTYPAAPSSTSRPSPVPCGSTPSPFPSPCCRWTPRRGWHAPRGGRSAIGDWCPPRRCLAS